MGRCGVPMGWVMRMCLVRERGRRLLEGKIRHRGLGTWIRMASICIAFDSPPFV